MVGRRIAGVIAGLIATWIPVGGMEMLTHNLYPPPPGTDMSNFAAVKVYVGSLPPTALILVLLGWLIGTLLGTFVAARIGRSLVTGYTVGAVLLAAGIFNAFAIPQPVWFSIVSFVIFVSMTWRGARWGAGAADGGPSR